MASTSNDRLAEIVKAVQEAGSAERAASILNLSPSTVRHHVREAARRGLSFDREESDPLEIRRLREQLFRQTAATKLAERRALYDKGIRESVFRLAEQPLEPPDWKPEESKEAASGEAVILMISDPHMGEHIDLRQMGGINSFNEKIARARLQRLFQGFVKLTTSHWSGPPPQVIYPLLMGDLVSGEIHDELAKTNDLLSIPAVKSVSECLVAGFSLLLEQFPDIPIRVVSLAGNHGRTTRKPEAKGFSIDSYDTLVAWVVESWFAAKGETRISFSAPASGDALININGWNFLATHGDRIGSRGGAGFVGPAATISRGFQRVIMDYATQGIIIDYILIGHFHTSMELPQGFVNGCISGPSEYSKANRLRPEPASQWMLAVSRKRGITRRWKIQVGDPSEGSIYKGRL